MNTYQTPHRPEGREATLATLVTLAVVVLGFCFAGYLFVDVFGPILDTISRTLA